MILVLFAGTSNRMATRAFAATISLTSCSASALVKAIQQANSTIDADVIELKPGCTYSLLNVNNNGADGPNGLPVIVSDLTLNGNGATILRDMVGGAAPFRILQVAPGYALTLRHVVLSGGMATADGGAVLNANGTLTIENSSFGGNRSGPGAHGGAVANSSFGTLIVSDSEFDGNISSYGGAIYDFGPMTISRSQFSNNTTNQGGGAVYIDGGSVSIADSRFINNHADNNGGGITYYSPLQLTLTQSTFSGNTSHGGGAYFDSGYLMVIESSRFQDNHADYGGAGYVAAPSNITASTFFANVATLEGGALYHSYGPTVLTNVTLGGNSAGNNGGAVNNAGNTLTASNTTIANNTAGAAGGGVYNTSDYAGTVILKYNPGEQFGGKLFE